MSKSHQVTVLVPAKNEALMLTDLIYKLRRSSRHKLRVVVLNSASTDDTSRVVKSLNVEEVRIDQSGKGLALRCGIDKIQTKLVVTIDGDGSYDPSCMDQMLEELFRNRKDIVYGSRFLPASSCNIGWFRRLGNKLFTVPNKLLYGSNCDFLTGFFVARTDVLKQLNLTADGYDIEAEIYSKARQQSLKIGEVPIAYKKNNTSKLNPVKDGWKILATLLKENQ